MTRGRAGIPTFPAGATPRVRRQGELQVGPRAVAANNVYDQRQQKQDQEYVEERLRDPDRGPGNAGESESARDEGCYEEGKDPA